MIGKLKVFLCVIVNGVENLKLGKNQGHPIHGSGLRFIMVIMMKDFNCFFGHIWHYDLMGNTRYCTRCERIQSYRTVKLFGVYIYMWLDSK